MNRLLVVALAAALSQFALACTTERTEIYEPAPAPLSDTGNAEKIDTAKVSDAPDLNFPVPAAADTPIDPIAVKVIDDHIDHLNGGLVDPSTVLPPVYDPTRLEQVNADGSVTRGPVEVLDPNVINYVPGIGLNPLLILDAPPSRGAASTTEGPSPF